MEGIDANVEDLLSNSSFNVNVFFATEAEENFDMGSIVHAFGNDYRDPRLEDVDAEDLDNALSYLVNQQGHSIAEVYGNGDNAFIRSVREEIDENSSEAMSELCALVRMDGQQMLDFIEKRNEAKDSLVLPKDYATMGIFNQWSGCGGMLDIQLEKDAVLPLSMVREFQIEGVRGDTNLWGGYTVDEVYGLVRSAWMPVHYGEGTETGVKEDYNFALDKARGADAIEAHGSDEPVSLKAAVRKPARRMAASPSRGRLRHRVPPPRNWPRDATPAHRHEKTPPSCRYIEDHHGRKVGKHHGIRQEHSRRAATAAPRPR